MKPFQVLRGVLLCAVALGLAVGCGGSSSNNNNNGDGNEPVITSLQPLSGLATGGTLVTIVGGNFTGTLTVTFDGVAATGVTLVDSTTLQATTPAHASGAVDVVVSNANGMATQADGFTYVSFPPMLPASDQQIDNDPPVSMMTTHPSICCSDANVYVAWSEPRAGANNDVWFQTSFDRGASWRTNAVRVNTDMPGVADAQNVRVCCSGLLVYVAWMDNRNGTYEPHFNRSVDGGNTWLPSDVRLNQPLAGTTNGIVGTLNLCCEGNTVVVVWTDDRHDVLGPPVTYDVFAARSIDGGSSFATDSRVNTNGMGTLQAAPIPRICCQAPNVYVTWEDERAGVGNPDIRFNRSTTNGQTWQPADVRLDQDAGVALAVEPEICCGGGHVYVAWRDTRNGGFDVYTRSSADNGASFAATEVRANQNAAGSALAGRPDICCEGTTLYVAWTDNRNLGRDVWFNRSTDGGATFQAADTRLDLGTVVGSQPNDDPEICCNGVGQLTVAWPDDRMAGAKQIYANFSSNGGASWQGTDTRLDSDAPAAGFSEFHSTAHTNLCCEGAFFYCAWRDTRNAVMPPAYDIFFNGNIP